MQTRLLYGLLALAAAGGTEAQSEENITVAVAGPLGGVYGEQMRRGAEAAVRNINNTGGLLGKNISISLHDDRCDPREAVKVAEEIVAANVAMVVGHFCSGASIPASEIYQDAGILQITPASPHPRLTENGYDTVFRLGGRDDEQGNFGGEFLLSRFSAMRAGILHDNSEYGQRLADSARETLQDGGGSVSYYAEVDARAGDFSEIIARLRGEGVGVVYYGGYAGALGRLVRQAGEEGYFPYVVAGDAAGTGEFWNAAGQWGDGAIFSAIADPRGSAASREVVGEFRRQGHEPREYTLYAYAAVQIWADAVRRGEGFNSGEISGILREHAFQTVIGEVSYRENGDRREGGWSWFVWDGGEYRDVGRDYRPF
ncbi:MAG: branched-chain amino acid ABC transporter substrate-binding protein [Alphaproteobacteria bacterium]|nr:branched-chain amino acid ABC transporter substrate-binding protein [Alphaproteobacteria bacterium]MDA8010534.1 branched-chain amino acid ABC transporter substrate-binding protein [Alphaproteobacteria bacterium]